MISVIVPVYNVKEFLPRCIESIMAQTCSCWELILVDDGSTDGSAEICDAYSERDSRIITVHQPNAGVSSARNAALAVASGQWICFVDSDDYASPSYLQDMLDRGADADIVVSGWRQGEVVRRFTDTQLRSPEFLQVFVEKAFINVWAKLFRKSAIVAAGASFDQDVKWAEDSIFFVKVLLHSSQVNLTSCVGYFYEFRENSAVGRIYSFRNELAGFNALYALMPEMIRLCSPEARKYFSPYLFVLRTYRAVAHLDIPVGKKLDMLREMKFDHRYLYYNPRTFNEKLVTWLFMHRQWRVLLMMGC